MDNNDDGSLYDATVLKGSGSDGWLRNLND